MLGKLLEQRGHECEEANDGMEALNMVKKVFRSQSRISISAIETSKAQILNEYYNAIFMDFIMPQMNGPDTTRAIPELGYYRCHRKCS